MPNLAHAALFSLAVMCAAPSALARDKSPTTIRDAEIEATLERLSAPIFAAAGLPAGSVEIFVIKDDDLNAFVAGRNMAFNTGLLIELEDPTELLGVIAHETGHLAGGHAFQGVGAANTARSISAASTILGIAAALAGAPQAGVAIAAGGQSTAQRTFLKYSRGQESAADQAAVSYLDTAGVDPSGLLDSLARLEAQQLFNQTARDPYAISHPLSRTRIERLRGAVEQSTSLNREVPEEYSYWHQRMRAKLQGFLENPGRVLRKIPDDGSEASLLARAVAYHRAPEPRRAIETIDRLLQLRPDDAYYLELKGQILFEAGDSLSAISPVRRAVSLAPNEPLIRVLLGQILLDQGGAQNEAEALQVLRSATLQDRYSASAWRFLALAESRAGEPVRTAIASAEYQILRGERASAKREAERAQAMSATGSAIWLRADDILDAVRRMERR